MGRHYPKEIKLEAVRLFETGKTHKEITETLRIRDPQRNKKWIRAYREKGVEAFEKIAKSGQATEEGEYPRHFKNPTFEQAQELIDEYIYFYNYERIQLKT